jgi:hypothetical protein
MSSVAATLDAPQPMRGRAGVPGSGGGLLSEFIARVQRYVAGP